MVLAWESPTCVVQAFKLKTAAQDRAMVVNFFMMLYSKSLIKHRYHKAFKLEIKSFIQN